MYSITPAFVNPPPLIALSVSDVTISEGDGGTHSAVFTVQLNSPAGVTFDIATADGTASAGSDYVAQSLTGQTFPAGSSTYTFSVPVNGDTAVEPNETFFVNLTNVVGAFVADGQGQGTIVNDDAAPPALSVSDVTISEGDGGTHSAVFTVALSSPAPAGGVTFDIATADGTASAGSDYVAQSLAGQTIPAGSSTYTFSVPVNGDTTFEPNETFFVNVTNVVGAAVADGQGQGTIVNDDAAPPALSVSDVTISEGDGGTHSAVFTVALSSPAPAGGVTFDIATADGTASAGSDYVAQSLAGQTIPAGSSTYTFSVPVNGDTTFEPNETFFVNVTNVVGAAVADGQGQGTIVNDDAAPPALSVSDVTISEGDGGTHSAVFTVALSSPAPAGGVTFDIATADGTASAGSSYVAQSLAGQTIQAGSSTYTFSVPVNGDTTFEPNETFFVNVTNVVGAAVADGQGQGTIVNDDAAPPPINVVNDSATTSEDTAINILVLGNDDFANPPAITVTTDGSHGTVAVDDNGTAGNTTDDFVVYTPAADFNGTDSFTYTVTSGGLTATATVSVTVNAVADIVADNVTVAQDSGANNLNLVANDTFENTARAITAVGAAAHGTTVINDNATPGNTADDFVVYTPTAAYNGPDTFTYTVTSGGTTETATVSVTVTAPPPSTTPTSGNDDITGTEGLDTIVALAGDDIIDGLGAGDLLLGNQGNDTASGRAGNDTIWGGQGNDSLDGAEDNDFLWGNEGADTIVGGDGANTIVGGQDSSDAADSITAGSGPDLIWGNGGADTIVADGGNNTLIGGFGADTIVSGAGDDIVFGNEDSDTISGGDGANLIFGGFGDDSILTGSGNDTIWGNENNDTIAGGTGADRYAFLVGSGNDQINGFSGSAEGDRLDLQGQTFTTGASADGDLLLLLSGGGTIELNGVAPAIFSPGFVL